jgi:RsmE family RNA methyltransferase
LLSERANVPALGAVLEKETAARAGGHADHGVAEVTFGVGPEGGWTEAEFLAATNAGFREARLGDNILRTETAVVAGLAAMHLYFDNSSGSTAV